MKEGSGRRQRELAEQMGVHESYVSRMLSGQREVSWRHVRIICEECGIDPRLMKPLWEAAANVQPSNPKSLSSTCAPICRACTTHSAHRTPRSSSPPPSTPSAPTTSAAPCTAPASPTGR
ncbi:helix-turn-helix domain-containing protein [Streptomyces sp. NPDC059680]|uniref:helix-turn-helix domain-containing protein n=1 Tax=Streptomyces sp. NPDC059680 TaxID=3346904 RepID=UPI0036A106D4